MSQSIRKDCRRTLQKIMLSGACCAIMPFAHAQPGTHQSAPFVLITNWYAQAEHGGFYEAQAEGLYEKAGLNVTLRMGGPQVNSVQLLAAKQGQCAISDDLGTISARSRGIPVTMVATSFQHDPTVLIAHSNVTSLAQLKTRTILISSNANSSWWPWAKATLGFTDAQQRPYTFNIQPFVINDNIAQQGYATSEPFSMAQAKVSVNVFPLSDAGYPPYGNAIACRDDVIDEHPELIEKFLAATMQGWKDYLADPGAGNALIRAANPNMTPAQLDFAVHAMRENGQVTGGDAKALGIGVITPERMRKTWAMVQQYHLVDVAKVGLDSVYTTKLINAHPVLP